MRLSQFQYELPPDRIALYPAATREASRLLRLGRFTGSIDTADHASDLVDSVRPGDCWVLNDTRVRPARIYCHKPTGARVELLILSLRGTAAEAM
ncbi:MAG: S-adenosylmethionine:tRNA ribosyltransferase-isomerase, partial [Myxococcota bacterium]